MIIRWISDKDLKKCKDKWYASFVDHTQKTIYRIYKEHLKDHPGLSEAFGNISIIHAANFRQVSINDGLQAKCKHIDEIYRIYLRALDAMLETDDEELLSVLNMAVTKNREYRSMISEESDE